jgi:lichenan operon transcriptional antiterminator
LREKILVDLLEESKVPVSLKEICNIMNLSESTIRNLIKEVKSTSKDDGFTINLLRGKGYILKITDHNLFKEYKKEKQANIDFLDVDQRVKLILFHLLQEDTYITMEDLLEHILVSRSTLSNDLNLVKEKLDDFNLKVISKPHHGLIIKGREQDLRKAFSKYVLHSTFYVEATQKYKAYFNDFDTEKMDKFFRSLLIVHRLSVSEIAMNNLLVHLKIMIYRVQEKNFIKADQLIIKEIDEVYLEVANRLAEWFYEEQELDLPKEEIHYLAAHISAKSSSDEMNPKRRERLYKDLKEILFILDKEFQTNFYQDTNLIESLLLHMYPLLDRLYYNLQLENPLINEMKLKYTNVFVVAFRLGELIEEKYAFKLTRDEIGYIAFHLAAHFEREKQNTIDQVKRIVVVCSTGGGNAHIIKMKLESVFTRAIILTVSNRNMIGFQEDIPDLILTTIPLETQYLEVPVIHIKNMLDEQELNRIVDKTAYYLSQQSSDKNGFSLRSLFSRDYFQIIKEENYIDIIREQSQKMIDDGVAAENYTDLVLERENRFSTIYENGVAGPHPIKLNAIKNTIGVTILKEPIEWQDKEVQIIFLINLKVGHLFLHKEISKFLMQIIDQKELKDGILRVTNYEQFLSYIEQLF